jgi:hypothetical protein
MDSRDTEIIARDVFAEIAKRFPSLQMVENHDDPVEISITMPVQPGLSHKVWLCLQNYDELGIKAGDHFYIEFFPCTKPDRVEKYLDAVTGFLSGEYRVLEHYRGATCYRATGLDSRNLTATGGGRLQTGRPCGFRSGLKRE